MYENQKKFSYTGDKPSPAVKADRMAKAARAVTDAVITHAKVSTNELAKAKAKVYNKAFKKSKAKKAK